MQSEATHERLITWAWYLGTILFCAFVLSDSINWNFGYDQGTFAYGGSAILKGARPYLDFWDIKPPNVFYVYSLAFTLFGESVRAIRIFDFLNALLTISLIWVVSIGLWNYERIWWRRLAAMFASFAYVVCYLIQGYQDTAQAETYALPLLLLSVLLVVHSNKRSSIDPWRLILSGAAIGITCFFKYPFGLFILLPAGVIWVNRPGAASRWKMFLLLGAGLALAIALQLLLLFPSGELQELWKITHQATLAYNQNNFSGSFGPITNLRTGLQMFAGIWPVIGLIGIVLLFVRSDTERRRRMAINLGLPILGILLGLIIVQAQNKGYKYHYQVMLPWAAMVIGAGMAEVIYLLRYGKLLVRIVIVGVTGLVLLQVAATLFMGDHFPPPTIDKHSYPNGYIGGEAVVDYVLKNSAPSDHIFIFGFQPYVYWITERTPANRFLNTIHFKPTNVAPELRAELLQSFNRPMSFLPTLLFVETGDHYTSQGNSNDDSWSMLNKRYPEIVRTINSCYERPDTVSGDILAFRRKPIAGGIR